MDLLDKMNLPQNPMRFTILCTFADGHQGRSRVHFLIFGINYRPNANLAVGVTPGLKYHIFNF